MESSCSSIQTTMKMSQVSFITLFVLCCSSIASTDAQDVCDQYAPTGGDVSVPINIKLEETHSLKWYRNGSAIFYRRLSKINQGKADDIDSKGNLKLTKLKRSDSGKYTFDVYDKDGKALTKDNNNVHLCVLDAMKKPTVEMKCLQDSKVQFTCKVQGTAHTTLEWFHDNEVLSEKADNLTKPAKDLPNNVTCKVSNNARSETSDPVKHTCDTMLDPVKKPTVEMKCLQDSKVQFTCKVQGTAHTTLEWFHDKKLLPEKVHNLIKPAEDLPNDVTCKVSNTASFETSDPVKHSCNSVLDMKVLGFSIWVFVGAGAGIVVLLIIIVIICCVMTRRKKRMRPKDEGEFRLQAHNHPDCG